MPPATQRHRGFWFWLRISWLALWIIVAVITFTLSKTVARGINLQPWVVNPPLLFLTISAFCGTWYAVYWAVKHLYRGSTELWSTSRSFWSGVAVIALIIAGLAISFILFLTTTLLLVSGDKCTQNGKTYLHTQVLIADNYWVYDGPFQLRHVGSDRAGKPDCFLTPAERDAIKTNAEAARSKSQRQSEVANQPHSQQPPPAASEIANICQREPAACFDSRAFYRPYPRAKAQQNVRTALSAGQTVTPVGVINNSTYGWIVTDIAGSAEWVLIVRRENPSAAWEFVAELPTMHAPISTRVAGNKLVFETGDGSFTLDATSGKWEQ